MDTRRYNASDPKWAHPEMVEENGYLIYHPVRESLKGFDEKTYEQLEEERNALRGAFLPVALSTCDPREQEVATWEEAWTEHGCPEEPDQAPVRMLVRRPKDAKKGRRNPGVLFFPGGGMFGAGTPELAVQIISDMVLGAGVDAVAVSPEYRLAPHNQYPASINDCHAAFLWMLEHADELGIDTDRIVIAGGSTGGQLALAVTFRLKAHGYHGIRPRGVISMEPVMDPTLAQDACMVSFEDADGSIQGWDGECAQLSYRLWLGDRYGDPTLPAEASPARATLDDVRGFPPTWLPTVPEFDPGRDADYAFAQLLHQARIYCEMHVWGGSSHILTLAKQGRLGRRIWEAIGSAFYDAVTYDLRRPWLEEE